MKVVYFTESLLPQVDGVSRTLARLFDFLERRGVGFRVYSPFVPDGSVRWSGRVRPVKYARFPLYRDYRVSWPGLRRIAGEVEAFRPDLIHLVSPTPLGFRALGLAGREGIPAVASFHTHFVSYFRYYRVSRLEGLGWALLRRFHNRCAATFAPSGTIARELEEQGIERVRLWSRGIDPHGFSPDRSDETLRTRLAPGGEPILLYAGRLVREKDLSDLVEMERLLRRRGVRHRLVLVGDGPMRSELESELPDAHFAGHREGGELARWYASADVFVFPSTTETFGNVVLEAMASGLPAVVTDRGGVTDLIEPGTNGLVARANHPEELTGRVAALLENPARREQLREGALRSARERDWDTVNQGLLNDYRDVAGE
ncbi:MAG: glycosyltransferase family 4 protein [Longimicrobiaceae bacterium]